MSEMTMPPGLMEALGGAAPPQQPAPEQPAPEMSAAEHLRQAIEHVQAAMQAEPDDIDSAKLAQAAKVLCIRPKIACRTRS